MKKSSEAATSATQRLRRIEGRHNPLVKQLSQAFSRAELTESGDCAIEGLRILEEAIRSGLRFSAVFFRDSAQDRADRLLPQLGAHVETLLLPDALFDSVVPSESPQGVAALVRLKEFALENILERLQVGPIVVLAGLQDPGNLGTILRSSEAFGSAGVVLGEGTVSPFNSKVVRASAGSVFRLPMVHRQAHGLEKKESVKLEEVSEALKRKNVRLIATSSHKGLPIDKADLKTAAAIFFGNEGSGLSRDLMAKMDEFISIPHAQQVESLNAGVAASIVLYEAARQRKNALSH
ncbi:MAG TPA: RNA methyltransferase [Candidatus Dormibacteraeota bacterium]|jgi:TrmH family RNA methyltransferase|nr:RNA methyltransferase [Candidatus Dormibacteraeota bacterium]